jgi:hypothetical protein
LFHLWLLRALLGFSTLRGSLLHLFDDFFSAIGSFIEFLLDLGLLGGDFFLLVCLIAFNLLLMFFIVGLCFLKVLVLEGGGTGHLVFELGFLGVEFFLGFFNLALDNLLNLRVVALALLLDAVELLNETLFGTGVSLDRLAKKFLFLSSLSRSSALSNELHLVVVIFGPFLDSGQLNGSLGFSGLESLAKFFNHLLTLSTLHG